MHGVYLVQHLLQAALICVVGVCRGLAELTQLRLISANGADVAATATPAAASKTTPIGPIVGGMYAFPDTASMLCYACKVPVVTAHLCAKFLGAQLLSAYPPPPPRHPPGVRRVVSGRCVGNHMCNGCKFYSMKNFCASGFRHKLTPDGI